MRVVSYTVGAVGFLLVWIVVAIVIGFGMAIIFPPSGERFIIGISLDWRNLPGTVVGLFAGVKSFRASIKERTGRARE
jgi:membrane associated rhomboid family serine protease